MFRLSDIIDLPIKQLNGKLNPKHTVKSILIDGRTNKAAALICKEGTIKKYVKIIPYERVVAIDMDGVIVTDETCIKKVQEKEIESYLLYEDVVHKTISSSAGNLQGILTDIFINLLTGKITSLEISEGYLDDIVSGRKTVPSETALEDSVTSEGITMYQRLN